MAENLLTVTEVKAHFVDVTEIMQSDIKSVVQKQIDGQSHSILKKIYSKNPEAKVVIEYTIIRNKQGKYEADFSFSADGEQFNTESHQGFKIATDLVSHAFDKWKRNVLGIFGRKRLFK